MCRLSVSNGWLAVLHAEMQARPPIYTCNPPIWGLRSLKTKSFARLESSRLVAVHGGRDHLVAITDAGWKPFRCLGGLCNGFQQGFSM